jgi:site-specific DNA-methyltransferase (adenine-specific)
MKGVYRWVPQQDWSQDWTDEALYKKYDITKDEIAFINSMIRPMGDGDE